MRCIYCRGKTKTVNSRSNSNGFRTWRRRKCTVCSSVFTTAESAEIDLALRVKKDTALEPFIYEKLLLDVYDTVSHRKTAYTDAKQLSGTIILKLLPCKSGVLSKEEIKIVTLDVLKRFDKAAYARYEARHR